MADTGEALEIRACPSAQRGAAVFGVLGLLIAGGGVTATDEPLFAVIGMTMGLALIVGAVRGVRARVAVRDDLVTVFNMWSTRRFDANAIVSVTVEKKSASFWIWGIDANVPPLRRKELAVLTFGDGSRLAPEALRRNFGDPDVDLVVSNLGDAFGMPDGRHHPDEPAAQ